MSRLIYLCMALALAIACVNAALPTKIELFHFYDEDYIQKIGAMPSQYKDRYQIPTSDIPGSNPTFRRTDGRSANVSTTGLIRPDCSTWWVKGNTHYSHPIDDYDYIHIDCTDGNSTITVTSGSFTHNITVIVRDYIYAWAENEEQKIVNQITNSSMTQLQKYSAITDWVADNTDYCGFYQAPCDMLINRCGDCWASTFTIVQMSLLAGIDAWSRRGNQVAGAGSGHMNAIAQIGNTFYIAEAGAVGNKPRYRNIYEEPFGFGISGSCIYQYDGKNKSVKIPTEVLGKNINQLGNGAYVFEHDITSLHIPATITNISRGAFFYTDTLETCTIDSKNPNYTATNSVVFTKTNKTMIFIPKSRTEVNIDKDTLHLGYAVFDEMKFTDFLIPGNVQSIDIYSFRWVKADSITIEYGLEYVGNSAFRYAQIPKVQLPSSVTSIGQLVFYSSKIKEVILSKNMKEIPRGTFRDSQLEKVVIPHGIETIGEDCFYGCRMVNVTIPTSVKTIQTNAFTAVTKTIFYVGTEEQWNQIFLNTTLPPNTTVVFNSEPEPEPEDPIPHNEVEKSSSVPAGEFPVWAVAVCAAVGAAVVAAAVIIAVVLLRKKKNSAPKSTVEMQSVAVSSPPEQTYPQSSPYAPANQYRPDPVSRPAPPPRRY